MIIAIQLNNLKKIPLSCCITQLQEIREALAACDYQKVIYLRGRGFQDNIDTYRIFSKVGEFPDDRDVSLVTFAPDCFRSLHRPSLHSLNSFSSSDADDPSKFRHPTYRQFCGRDERVHLRPRSYDHIPRRYGAGYPWRYRRTDAGPRELEYACTSST